MGALFVVAQGAVAGEPRPADPRRLAQRRCAGHRGSCHYSRPHCIVFWKEDGKEVMGGGLESCPEAKAYVDRRNRVDPASEHRFTEIWANLIIDPKRECEDPAEFHAPVPAVPAVPRGAGPVSGVARPSWLDCKDAATIRGFKAAVVERAGFPRGTAEEWARCACPAAAEAAGWPNPAPVPPSDFSGTLPSPDDPDDHEEFIERIVGESLLRPRRELALTHRQARDIAACWYPAAYGFHKK